MLLGLSVPGYLIPWEPCLMLIREGQFRQLILVFTSGYDLILMEVSPFLLLLFQGPAGDPCGH